MNDKQGGLCYGENKRFAQGLAIGSTIGLAAGIAANHYYRKKQKMSPDKVLDQIKAAFLKEGPIEGSWISFDTEHMQKIRYHNGYSFWRNHSDRR